MSRSKRKTKKRGITTAVSEKQNKRDANRKLRRIIRQKVKNKDFKFPTKRSNSNVWHFDKDGKIYDHEMTAKDMRK